MVISGAILLLVIALMALDLKVLPLEVVSTLGAIACILTGCLTEKQAYQSVDWVTIFLFAGMLAIAEAMDRSGAARMIANWAVVCMGENPSPLLMLAVLFLWTVVLTQFMPNTACAALLAPIGLSLAKNFGVNPQAMLMAITVAASCAFATPVGTPPNTLVLGPGQYRFIDFVKVGAGLVVVCFIVSLLIIPWVWPLIVNGIRR
jgi:di/tricarboxylate transporter